MKAKITLKRKSRSLTNHNLGLDDKSKFEVKSDHKRIKKKAIELIKLIPTK